MFEDEINKLSAVVHDLESSMHESIKHEYYRRIRFVEVALEQYWQDAKDIHELNNERAINLNRMKENFRLALFFTLAALSLRISSSIDAAYIIIIYVLGIFYISKKHMDIQNDDASRLVNIIACEANKINIIRESDAIGLHKDILETYVKERRFEHMQNPISDEVTNKKIKLITWQAYNTIAYSMQNRI